MRLYFSFGGNKIGIDTKAETWTDFRNCDESEIGKHRFIELDSTDDFCALGREIDFNCYDYTDKI